MSTQIVLLAWFGIAIAQAGFRCVWHYFEPEGLAYPRVILLSFLEYAAGTVVCLLMLSIGLALGKFFYWMLPISG